MSDEAQRRDLSEGAGYWSAPTKPGERHYRDSAPFPVISTEIGGVVASVAGVLGRYVAGRG
jgi:hypothetical protein